MVFGFLGRVPLHQLFVVTLVGVASGVYIYRPLLETWSKNAKARQAAAMAEIQKQNAGETSIEARSDSTKPQKTVNIAKNQDAQI